MTSQSKNNVIILFLLIYAFGLVLIQPPQNQSVCEGKAVNFTCVVMFTSRTPSAAIWLSDSGSY